MELAELARALPDLTIVLNHLGQFHDTAARANRISYD